jgi:hypothetical protein
VKWLAYYGSPGDPPLWQTVAMSILALVCAASLLLNLWWVFNGAHHHDPNDPDDKYNRL